MSIFHRYELRSIDPAGGNQHVSWHALAPLADRAKAEWIDKLCTSDSDRDEYGVRFYIRKVRQ